MVLKNVQKTDNHSLVFLSQYIKDLSFENFSAQKLKFTKKKLEYKIDLNIKRKKVDSKIFEVTLLVLLEASANNTKRFILEISHAGTFSSSAPLEGEILKRLAFTHCPTIMFPYLRQIVFNITRDSGYLPVTLNHINFDEIFTKKTLDQL